jgi:hypothetical protein
LYCLPPRRRCCRKEHALLNFAPERQKPRIRSQKQIVKESSEDSEKDKNLPLINTDNTDLKEGKKSYRGSTRISADWKEKILSPINADDTDWKEILEEGAG